MPLALSSTPRPLAANDEQRVFADLQERFHSAAREAVAVMLAMPNEGIPAHLMGEALAVHVANLLWNFSINAGGPKALAVGSEMIVAVATNLRVQFQGAEGFVSRKSGVAPMQGGRA